MITLNDPDLLRPRCLIDGVWCEADDAETFEVTNPATGETLALMPAMKRAETERAIAAAAGALPAWRQLGAHHRGNLLRAWHGLILEHAADLAQLLTAEQGKPLADARAEVAYAASFVDWFAEEGKRAYGDVIPSPVTDQRILVLKEAVGVCAAITPWNFPYAMVTRKVAPALAAGCTIVLKPAEQTPLCATALGVLAERAGIPAGVFNIVTGEPEAIGSAITASDTVRKISFTGSTQVGRLLMRQSSDTLKKLSLELGGNAPFIVFDDADLDAAVAGVMVAKFRNAGQACIAANRIYVQDAVYDAFADKLVTAINRLRVGHGDEANVEVGPLIDAAAVEKVEAHIADAVALGARVLAGGTRHQLGGNFFCPTVLADASASMKLAVDETFGPLAPLFRFRRDAEVIHAANAVEYGLGAYVYSRDLARIWRTIESLEVGMVGVNSGSISTAVAPFGGIKQSGLGREGAKYGLDEYLVLKYVSLGGLGS